MKKSRLISRRSVILVFTLLVLLFSAFFSSALAEKWKGYLHSWSDGTLPATDAYYFMNVFAYDAETGQGVPGVPFHQDRTVRVETDFPDYQVTYEYHDFQVTNEYGVATFKGHPYNLMESSYFGTDMRITIDGSIPMKDYISPQGYGEPIRYSSKASYLPLGVVAEANNELAWARLKAYNYSLFMLAGDIRYVYEVSMTRKSATVELFSDVANLPLKLLNMDTGKIYPLDCRMSGMEDYRYCYAYTLDIPIGEYAVMGVGRPILFTLTGKENSFLGTEIKDCTDVKLLNSVHYDTWPSEHRLLLYPDLPDVGTLYIHWPEGTSPDDVPSEVPVNITFDDGSTTAVRLYAITNTTDYVPEDFAMKRDGIRSVVPSIPTIPAFSSAFTVSLTTNSREEEITRVDLYILPETNVNRVAFRKWLMGIDTEGSLAQYPKFEVFKGTDKIGDILHSDNTASGVSEYLYSGTQLLPWTGYILKETQRPKLKDRNELSEPIRELVDEYGGDPFDAESAGETPTWYFYLDDKDKWHVLEQEGTSGQLKYIGYDTLQNRDIYSIDNITEEHDHITVKAVYMDESGKAITAWFPEDITSMVFTLGGASGYTGHLSADNKWTDSMDTLTGENRNYSILAILQGYTDLSEKYTIAYQWQVADESGRYGEARESKDGSFGGDGKNKRYLVTVVVTSKRADLRFVKWTGIEALNDDLVEFTLTKNATGATIPVEYELKEDLFLAENLSNGTWELKETKAPAGFDAGEWIVTVENREITGIKDKDRQAVAADEEGVYCLMNNPVENDFVVHVAKEWQDVAEEDKVPVKVMFVPVLAGSSLEDDNLRYVGDGNRHLPDDEDGIVTVELKASDENETNWQADARLNSAYIYYAVEIAGDELIASYKIKSSPENEDETTSWQFVDPEDGETVTVDGADGALVCRTNNSQHLFVTNVRKSITAKVKWMDHQNKDGIRPDSVTVELQKKVTTQVEGEDEPTVSWTTVGEAVEVKDWEDEDGVGVGTATFNVGHEENAEYRVRVTSGTRAEGNEKIITFGSDDACYKESHEPDSWEPAVVLTAQKRISVEKKWEIDIERLDKPDQITVILQKKPEKKEKSGDDKEKKDWGKPVDTLELSSDNSWKGVFTANRYASETKKEGEKTTTEWKGEITYRVRETKLAELKGFLKGKIEAAEDAVIGMLPSWMQNWVKGKVDKYADPEDLEDKAFDWIYEKANDTSSALGDMLQDYLKDSVPEDGEYITLSVPSRTSLIRGEIDEHDTMYRVSYKEGDDGTVITNLAAEDVTIWKRWINIEEDKRPESVYLMLLSKFDKDYMEMAQAQEIPLVGQYTPVLNPLEGDTLDLLGFIKLPIAIGKATPNKKDDASAAAEDGGDKKEKPEWTVHFVVKKYGETGIPQDFKGSELVSGAIGEVARAVLGSWASILEYVSLNPFSGYVSVSLPAVRVPDFVSQFASFAGLPDLKGLNTLVTNTWVGLDPAIGGTKTWKGDTGLEEMRPKEVYIQIYKKGEGEEEKGDKVGTVKVSADNYWTWTYTKDIEKDKEYIIEETADEAGTITEIEGYYTEIDGYDVTNTLIATRVKLPVEKKIDGPDREDGDDEKFVFTIKQTDNQGTVEAGNGGEEKKSTPPKIKKDKLEITDEGKGEFTVYFFEPGEYHFTVTEEKGKNEKRYTYDTAARKVTVTVTEDEEDKKKLKAEWTFEVESDDADDDSGDGTDTASRAGEEKSDVLIFTNGYKPAAKVDWKLPVEKKIDGPAREDGDEETFNFTIAVADDDDSDGADAQPSGGEEKDGKEQPRIKDEKLQIADEGKGAFEITFTDPGTYEFTLTEKAGNNKAYSYDMAERTVTVVVEEDKNDAKEPLKVKSWTVKVESDDDNTGDTTGDGQPSGQAEAGGTGEGAEGSEASPGSVVFTNKYKPVPKVTVYIPFVKEVIGPERKTGDLESFVFRIAVEETEDENASDDSDDDAEPPRIKNDEIGLKDCGAGIFVITFTKAGEYHFTVTEDRGENELYVYDTAVYHVSVDVKEDETDAEEPLKATWSCKVEREEDDEKTGAVDDESDDASDDIVFKNIYQPEGTVTLSLPIEKKVQGPDRDQGEETFAFTINAVSTEKDGKGEAACKIEKDRLEITGEGSEEFVISFSKEGEYVFRILEEQGSNPAYTYDTELRIVAVSVEKNEDGTLKAEKPLVSAGDLVFKNVYQPAGTVTLVIPVEKKLDGPERETRDLETFTFAITDKSAVAEGTPEIQEAEVRIRDEGKSEFSVSFSREGEYTFAVAEKEGENEAYTYDTTERTVKVSVKDENGALKAEISDGSALVFTNTFDPPVEPAELKLSVEKKIDGPERKDDEKETFAFAMEAEKYETDERGEAACKIEKDRLEITDEGKAEFSVTFEKEGEYIFAVTEEEGSAEHYTYDKTEHRVTVKVTREGRYLKAEATGNADMVFTNVFDPPAEPLYVPLPLEKKVLGPERAEGDEETFVFTIKAENIDEDNRDDLDPVIRGDKLEIRDEGTGEFLIRFGKAGTYTFTVAEKAGKNEAYTYDTAKRTVTVTVEPDGRKLKADMRFTVEDKDGNAEEADGLVFKNVYETPGTVTLVLPIEKKILGPAREAGEIETFGFVLGISGTPEADAKIEIFDEKIQIRDEGESEFVINFNKVGTYGFTVAEEAGSFADYSYDTTARVVTVTVSKNDDGELEAEWRLPAGSGDDADTEPPESIVFTNVFDPPAEPITLRLPVEKRILGPARPAGELEEFTFILEEDEDDPVTPVIQSNKLVLVDNSRSSFIMTFSEPGEYAFTLTEEEGSHKDYTYDTAERRVAVSVVKEGRELKADWTVALEDDDWEPRHASAVVFGNVYQPEGTVTVVLPVISYIIGPPRSVEEMMVFTYDLQSEGIASREGEENPEDIPEDNPEEEYPEDIPEEEYPEDIPEEEYPEDIPEEEYPEDIPEEEYPEDIPEIAVGTLEVMDEGGGSFAIVFRAPGEYVFAVRQFAAEDERYILDTDVREVHVTVTREDGVLKASWDYFIRTEDDTTARGATARGTAASAAEARAAVNPGGPSRIVFVNYYRTPTTAVWQFTKKWVGGRENDIDWKMYDSAGNPVNYKFTRTQVTQDVWTYSTWVDATYTYYLVEDVPTGYTATYTNVGGNAGVTDRCCDGGTITNTRKSSPTPPWNPPGSNPGTVNPTPTPTTPVVPHTGDSGQPLWYMLSLTAACLALSGLWMKRFRTKRKEK